MRDANDRELASIGRYGTELHVGNRVHFAHQGPGEPHTIEALSIGGFVRLADIVGDFAPHLFVRIK